MSRFIAIDWGEKYIGLAISDPLGIIAQGLDVWEREDDDIFLKKLSELIEKYDVKGIVIGFPISLKGHENEKTEKVKKIAKKIKDSLKIPVFLEDERFTTIEAEKILIDGNMRRDKRKIIKNKQAAVIILEKFLSSVNLDTLE
ncbi:MAG TPA: Holliday junction resolvase RuvX [Dictyoglomaceae bacterium]|nr:Holliday junction resolvase RuvX [Dictyoglomaceae bacterium]HOL38796.1 Holliday junction resolvase RuvX [Dictyoglomaceae bacterium]HOP94501.1 Holliday junction resolvase RuvX [Dictyoglomaceae bacterium]HPP15456.1 Holliday junction resolvase RuvX [Dictyoglomaceae bacterium]HPU43234.1 Holliday junction resolvase RuvX [Dictyoglomaceae bacterium]